MVVAKLFEHVAVVHDVLILKGSELTRIIKSPLAPLACLCCRKKIAKEGYFIPSWYHFLGLGQAKG
jgi:hypothetical protein